jgi:hypothetical protein
MARMMTDMKYEIVRPGNGQVWIYPPGQMHAGTLKSQTADLRVTGHGQLVQPPPNPTTEEGYKEWTRKAQEAGFDLTETLQFIR